MNSTLVVSVLLASLVVMASAQPSLVRAQNEPTDVARAQAGEQFRRGVAAYQASDFTTALAAFQEAYRLAPHPSVRVNIANCYDQLHRPREALFHFEHYVNETSDARTSARRREVEAAIRRVRATLTELRVDVTPEGALVRIDGDERRAPILDPLLVEAGEHVITAQLPGYRIETRTVTTRPGGHEAVTIRLERAAIVEPPTPAVVVTPPPVAPDGPTPTPDSPQPVTARPVPAEIDMPTPTPSPTAAPAPDTWSSTRRPDYVPAFAISAGVTGALVIGAAICGVIAMSANDDFERAVVRAGMTTGAEREAAIRAGLDAGAQTRDLSAVADALGIAGAVAAVVTGTFLVLELTDGGAAASERTTATPWISPQGAGVTVRGSF